jgi:class 3 adenylate cyclase/tetratricopeptide (TPR) repeat protein
MRACPNCGEKNPDRAKFCLACATPLTDEPTAAREVRKTVTVVFSDVIGSTALGERADPEILRRVMGRYFEEMRAALERHGGTVEKFIGDAVVAVFGIPQLHEDDALRAVKAAAEMQSGLAALNEQLERERGVSIAARTGVNTGAVVAGDPATGQSFATGDAVNVAARLEQAAQAGEILIGAETYHLVRDAVRVEAVEPLHLKGKSEAVAAFRLLEVLPETSGHVRRLAAPMVGRDRERRRLQDAFAQAVDDRSCQLFTILGSAGVGKSRLVEEFVHAIGDRATVLTGRSLPYGEGITFWPVLEVVTEAAELSDGDTPAETRAKILSLIDDDEGDAIAERVAEVLGRAEVTAGAEGFWGVRRLLEALARRRPLVVVFDDIHWGEPTFLDLVEHVADWSRDAPILLLCMARPELLDARSGWGGGKLNATSVLLEPLGADECALLVENLLGQTELSPEAYLHITETAEGNPLFVEEVLSMLIDDGLLERRNGHWSPVADLTAVKVPPTIQALLSARLDRLAGEERAVVERAAIEGRVFHRGAVAELTHEGQRSRVGTHLMTLVRKELIRPDRASFAGEEAFRFRHLLIRDAAYDSLPKEDRAGLHERFADWLERKLGEREAEYEEIIGYHLEQASRYRAELGPVDERGRQLARRAAERLTSAGRRAMSREDMHAAAKLLSRSAELLPADSKERLELLPDLGEALRECGDFSHADAVLDEAIERAMARGDRRLEVRGRLERAYVAALADAEGDAMSDALAMGEEASVAFSELGDDAGLARALDVVGQVQFWKGRFAASQDALERALEFARRVGDGRVEARILAYTGAVVFHGPTPAEDALRYFETQLKSAHARDSRIDQGYVLENVARCKALLGRFDEARDHVREMAGIFEELGRATVDSLIGLTESSMLIERQAGNASLAERTLREGYQRLEAMGEKGFLSTIAGDLAHVLYGQGRDDEAERFARASADAAQRDDVVSQVLWRTALAKVLARRGDLVEAERLARAAVAIAGDTDFIWLEANALMDLAEAMRLAERIEEAAAATREALRLFEQKGDVVSAAKARALLDTLAVA